MFVSRTTWIMDNAKVLPPEVDRNAVLDLYDARYAMEANVINMLTGLGSIVLALSGVAPVIAGFFYLVLGPVRAIHGARSGRRRRVLERP